MKKILFLFSMTVIFGGCSFAQTPASENKSIAEKNAAAKPAEDREKFDPLRNPAADLQLAISRAQQENKRIILDVGGEWCGWCRFMDNFFTRNKPLGKLRDDNYVWVKVNFSDENENKEFLSKYPEIKGYPHLFVLESDGTLLKSKDTGELEGENNYDLKKFTDFLNEFAPVK